jgi:hypothetical protein
MSNGMYNALTPDAGNTVYLPALKINASGVGGNLAIQNLSNAGVSGVLVKFYNQQGQEVQQINAPSILPFSSFHLSSQQFGIPPGFDELGRRLLTVAGGSGQQSIGGKYQRGAGDLHGFIERGNGALGGFESDHQMGRHEPQPFPASERHRYLSDRPVCAADDRTVEQPYV